jgi:hypothetical protein
MESINTYRPKKRCPYYNTSQIAEWYKKRYGSKLKFKPNTSNEAKYKQYYAIFMNV